MKKNSNFFDMENLRKIRKVWIDTRNWFWLASYFNLENNEKKAEKKLGKLISLRFGTYWKFEEKTDSEIAN